MIEHSMPTIGREEQRAVAEVFRTRFISEGPRTKEFERHLADFLGVQKTVCVPSGFVAIFLSVTALGGNSLKVFMPSFVCREVYDAVKMAGAEPILCDIAEDFNISVSDLKKKLSKKTRGDKALLLPHMFGLPADVDPLLELDLPIIEDCANSIGATYKGKQTGTVGDMGILSFEATKMMTTGQGGAVVSKNAKLMDKIQRLKFRVSLDQAPRYSFFFTDIQSGMGIIQLQKLKGFIKKRKKIAERYQKEFRALPLMLPGQFPGRDHVFYRYMVGSGEKRPKQIIESAHEKGVKIKQVVPGLHRELGLPGKEFPMTEKALKQWVSVPIYPSLTNSDTSLIIKCVKEIYSDQKMTI